MEESNLFTLHKLVLNDIPIKFLKSMVYEILPEAYRQARQLTYSNYAKPEAKVMLPYNRRAKAEELFRAKAMGFPEMRVRVKDNFARNTYYTQVESGRILMTISAVNTPKDMVTAARFRETLARASHIQRGLFGPTDEELEVDNGNAYYAILLHSKVSCDDDSGYFARLAFPSRDCRRYVANIDLRYFLRIHDDMPVAIEEEIHDERDPILKQILKTQKVR